MVAVTDAAPLVANAGQSPAAWLGGDTPAGTESVAAYVAAGERMFRLMQATLYVCAGLFVLVAVAWLLGLLPGAIRLF